MIRKNGSNKIESRFEMRGGTGEVRITHLIEESEISSAVRLCATLSLAPGASIGAHPHDGEDEIFYVISGCGEFNDNGTIYEIVPGDTMLTGNGAFHSVKNTSNRDELLIMATIIKYSK
jgi:mannose-6-phosphate isomerase-like protein (cupin superfamily)